MATALRHKHDFGFEDLNIGGYLTTKPVFKEVAISLDGIGKGATAPTLTRDTNCIGWAFTISDDGYMQFEVPVNWDGVSDIEIFIHIYTDDAYVATSNEVETNWQATWSAVPEDGTEAIDGATHTGTITSGDIDTSTVAKGLQEIELGAIPAAEIAQHDVICLLFSRIALIGGSDPGNEPVLIQAEYEYASDKLGEHE